jgi:hypothetical protein
LGFTSAIRRGDPEIENKILRLLTSFSEAKSDFQKSDTQDGSFRQVSKSAAITTFSDLIVYSCPWSELKPIPYLFIQSLANVVASIVLDAMRMGCLIRGAITSGSLYHERGVVFGQALIDAYEIESRIAKHPRVVVADKIAEFAGGPILFRDDDGLWCLNYMKAAFDCQQIGINLGSGYVEHNKQWISGIRQQCDVQIETLRSNNNLTGLCHWRWFRKRFDQMITKIDASLTGESLPPP